MSINTARNQYGGTPQHPTLFGVTFSNNPETVFWLKGTSIPARTIKHETIPWMNGDYHFAARSTGSGVWTCSFYVFEDMAPMKWLYSWYQQTYDWRTGTYGAKANYSTDASVFLMDSTAQNKTLHFQMFHVMITDIGGIEGLDFANDSPLAVSCSFAYEDFDISFDGDGFSR